MSYVMAIQKTKSQKAAKINLFLRALNNVDVPN